MTLFVVLLPLLNFLLMLTFSRLVHWKQLASLVIFSMCVTLTYLITRFGALISGEVTVASIGNWVHSGLFEVNWNFSIDTLTYTMLIVVLTVSTLVHLYSTEYMSEDPHISRFISYLSLFTFFMLLLITSDNFVNLFLGWEGVGLCSYLLISFWFTRIQANKAAIKAMVVNRIADLAFTIGMLALFYTFQTSEFNLVFGLTPYMVDTTILFGGGQLSPLTLTATLLFLGAMGKSAQIGLHTWLPDAMEGPTPVSALIHAATMVTAGVFLLIRSSGLYEFTPSVLNFITVVGAATAFMAATSGLLQNDLKKVIAYSTCSQLGYMVFACGLSSYALSLFHLSNHAFFKALLFLSAGAVIHAISSEQDMRRLGGLLRILPYTYAMFLIGSLALMGFPFLTGYYSKDLILEVAASTITNWGYYAYWLGIITAFFTAFYSFRLLNLVFYGPSRSARTYLLHAHELTPRMAVALAVLSLGSIFLGFFFRDLFVGFGTSVWSGVISQAPETTGAQLAGEFLVLNQKLTPLYGSIYSVGLLFISEHFHKAELSYIYNNYFLVGLHRFLSSKWGFDTVYNRLINQPLLKGAYNITFSLIDKGLLEVVGPTGGGKLTYRAGIALARFQTGRAYDYAAFILAAICLAVIAADYSLLFSLSPQEAAFTLPFLSMISIKNWLTKSATFVYKTSTKIIKKVHVISKDLERSFSTQNLTSTKALCKLVSVYFGVLAGLFIAHLYCLYQCQLQVDEAAKRLLEAMRLLQSFLTPGHTVEAVYWKNSPATYKAALLAGVAPELPVVTPYLPPLPLKLQVAPLPSAAAIFASLAAANGLFYVLCPAAFMLGATIYAGSFQWLVLVFPGYVAAAFTVTPPAALVIPVCLLPFMYNIDLELVVDLIVTRYPENIPAINWELARLATKWSILGVDPYYELNALLGSEYPVFWAVILGCYDAKRKHLYVATSIGKNPTMLRLNEKQSLTPKRLSTQSKRRPLEKRIKAISQYLQSVKRVLNDFPNELPTQPLTMRVGYKLKNFLLVTKKKGSPPPLYTALLLLSMVSFYLTCSFSPLLLFCFHSVTVR